jgi:hypothetical protein
MDWVGVGGWSKSWWLKVRDVDNRGITAGRDSRRVLLICLGRTTTTHIQSLPYVRPWDSNTYLRHHTE